MKTFQTKDKDFRYQISDQGEVFSVKKKRTGFNLDGAYVFLDNGEYIYKERIHRIMRDAFPERDDVEGVLHFLQGLEERGLLKESISWEAKGMTVEVKLPLRLPTVGHGFILKLHTIMDAELIFDQDGKYKKLFFREES